MLENQEEIKDSPSRSERKSEATQKKILFAAEQIFARQGLNGARVREIADAAGVTGAALYLYYPSKEALYEAVLEQGLRPLIGLLEDFASSKRELESASDLVGAVMQHLAAHPYTSRLIYLEAMAEGESLTRLVNQWFRPLFRQIVGQLQLGEVTLKWNASQIRVIAALFFHLSFSHFALAPLLGELFESDPLSEEGIESQSELVTTVIQQLFSPQKGNE